ncbi:MAG: hypothetical protein IJ298_05685, partial [Ruminococcus sp.]|nr:hypothetical protein [Ruminococcus sp.]
MKTAIIYSSETGFTKKYALWLEEKLGSDAKAYSLKEAKKVNFDDCDALVYGGWVCAAQINGAKWFKEKMPSWAASGKKLALWATGGSPMESPDIPKALDVMLTEDEKKIAKVFYCPGGFNYENMKPMYSDKSIDNIGFWKRKAGIFREKAGFIGNIMQRACTISDKFKFF